MKSVYCALMVVIGISSCAPTQKNVLPQRTLASMEGTAVTDAEIRAASRGAIIFDSAQDLEKSIYLRHLAIEVESMRNAGGPVDVDKAHATAQREVDDFRSAMGTGGSASREDVQAKYEQKIAELNAKRASVMNVADGFQATALGAAVALGPFTAGWSAAGGGAAVLGTSVYKYYREKGFGELEAKYREQLKQDSKRYSDFEATKAKDNMMWAAGAVFNAIDDDKLPETTRTDLNQRLKDKFNGNSPRNVDPSVIDQASPQYSSMLRENKILENLSQLGSELRQANIDQTNYLDGVMREGFRGLTQLSEAQHQEVKEKLQGISTEVGYLARRERDREAAEAKAAKKEQEQFRYELSMAGAKAGIFIASTLAGEVLGNQEVAVGITAVGTAGIDSVNAIMSFSVALTSASEAGMGIAGDLLAGAVLTGNFLSIGMNLFKAFGGFGRGPSAEVKMLMRVLEQVAVLNNSVRSLSADMKNYFNGLDAKLAQSFDVLNRRLDLLEASNARIEDRLASLPASFNLLSKQMSRLDRSIRSYVTALANRDFAKDAQSCLAFKERFPNQDLGFRRFEDCVLSALNHATQFSRDAIVTNNSKDSAEPREILDSLSSGLSENYGFLAAVIRNKAMEPEQGDPEFVQRAMSLSSYANNLANPGAWTIATQTLMFTGRSFPKFEGSLSHTVVESALLEGERLQRFARDLRGEGLETEKRVALFRGLLDDYFINAERLGRALDSTRQAMISDSTLQGIDPFADPSKAEKTGTLDSVQSSQVESMGAHPIDRDFWNRGGAIVDPNPKIQPRYIEVNDLIRDQIPSEIWTARNAGLLELSPVVESAKWNIDRNYEQIVYERLRDDKNEARAFGVEFGRELPAGRNIKPWAWVNQKYYGHLEIDILLRARLKGGTTFDFTRLKLKGERILVFEDSIAADISWLYRGRAYQTPFETEEKLMEFVGRSNFESRYCEKYSKLVGRCFNQKTPNGWRRIVPEAGGWFDRHRPKDPGADRDLGGGRLPTLRSVSEVVKSGKAYRGDGYKISVEVQNPSSEKEQKEIAEAKKKFSDAIKAKIKQEAFNVARNVRRELLDPTSGLGQAFDVFKASYRSLETTLMAAFPASINADWLVRILNKDTGLLSDLQILRSLDGSAQSDTPIDPSEVAVRLAKFKESHREPILSELRSYFNLVGDTVEPLPMVDETVYWLRAYQAVLAERQNRQEFLKVMELVRSKLTERLAEVETRARSPRPSQEK